MGLVLLLRKVDNKIKISEGCEEMDGIGYVLRNLRLNKGLTQKYIYKNGATFSDAPYQIDRHHPKKYRPYPLLLI